MTITYDSKYDLLYLKFCKRSKVITKEIDEDITFDIDVNGKIVGIEVLSASEHIDLANLLPVKIEKRGKSSLEY